MAAVAARPEDAGALGREAPGARRAAGSDAWATVVAWVGGTTETWEAVGFCKTGSWTLTRVDPADEPVLFVDMSAAGAGFPAAVFPSAEAVGEEGRGAGRSSADLTPQPTKARAKIPSVAKREVFMEMEGRPPCRPISLWQWVLTAQRPPC